MNRKVIGGFAVFLLAVVIVLLLLPRPSGDDGSVGEVGQRLTGGPAERSEDLQGMRDAKHRDRSDLREMLPPGVRIEAEEIRGSLARGKVQVIFPDGMQIFAERVSASADKQRFVAEGNAVIWLAGGRSCIGKETGPLQWWMDNGRLRVGSVEEGITTTKLPQPQSEERMRELSESPSWFFGR